MRVPPFLQKLYRGWMAVSHAIGRVMSTIILTALWIVGFGLYAIVLKIIRVVRRGPPVQTYWIDIPREQPESFRRPF